MIIRLFLTQLTLNSISKTSKCLKYTTGELIRSREQKYAFDYVFTDEATTKIYDQTAHNLIDPLFKGFNGCVFAYGATGTGKTYTMLGYNDVAGLCGLSLKV